MISPSVSSYDPSAFAKAQQSAHLAEQSHGLDRAVHDHAKPAAERGVSRAPDTDTGSFLNKAKAAVKTSLVAFRNEIRSAFKDFGLGEDALNKLVKSLTDPVLEALKSGTDFVAQIFVAGVKQVTAVGASGAAQSVDLVFKGIEIEFNHSTGELSIDQTSLSIRQSTSVQFEGNAPQLVDATDGTLTALPDLFAEFSEFMKEITEEFLGASVGEPNADGAPAKPADAAVIEAADAAEDAAEQDGPESESGAGAAEDAASAADEGPSDASLRLHIDFVERFTNARMQQITRIRFDLAFSIGFAPQAQPISAVGTSGTTDGGVSLTA